jgi:hypothetical protein
LVAADTLETAWHSPTAIQVKQGLIDYHVWLNGEQFEAIRKFCFLFFWHLITLWTVLWILSLGPIWSLQARAKGIKRSFFKVVRKIPGKLLVGYS